MAQKPIKELKVEDALMYLDMVRARAPAPAPAPGPAPFPPTPAR